MKRLLFLMLLSSLSTIVLAKEYKVEATRTEEEELGMLNLSQSPIELDSLLSVWYKNNISDSYETFINDFVDVDFTGYAPTDALPDSVYAARLDMLATAISLPYNPVVKNYILLYTSRKSSMMKRLLGLAQYYMPIFEQELDLNGLPAELKILPIIESALNPRATSRVGASGLWQFMLRTGKYYGLECNTFIDERYDPIKSTQAACGYLRDMYKIYGDWTLVIASYNCGAGNVNKAIRRAGPNAKTYWDIYDYLPRETRGYIPAFIAATYAYTFHKAHGLEPVAPPHPIVTDTVMINKMMHFEQISSVLDIPVEVIQGLNPQYKLDIIPAKEKRYPLILPASDVTNFVVHESEIYARDTVYLKQYLNSGEVNLASSKAVGGSTKSSTSSSDGKITYKVKKGDNLGSIAKRYKTTTKSLMALNGIRDARKLRIGQVLIIRK